MPCPLALSLSKGPFANGPSRDSGALANPFPLWGKVGMGEFPGILRPFPTAATSQPVEGATLVVAHRSPQPYPFIRPRARLAYSRSSLYMISCGNISSHDCFCVVSPCASEKDCAMSKALALAPMP